MARAHDDRRLQGALDMLVLRTLQWGPQHGHGTSQAIRAPSDDLLEVEAGSLYPSAAPPDAARRFKAERDVSEASQRAEYSRLNAAGKARLVREQDRWSRLVQAIGRITSRAPANTGK